MIDTKGLACPEPVLLTKKAVDKGLSEVQVLVDNNTAKNNVERFLKNAGFNNLMFDAQGEDIIIRATK